jgi:hypothetical protein
VSGSKNINQILPTNNQRKQKRGEERVTEIDILPNSVTREIIEI